MSTYEVRPVTVSVHISADPDQVFDFVSDTRNDPLWCANVTEVRQVSGEGVAVGSVFSFHQTVETRGRALESDVDVVVLEVAERSIRWRVEDRFQVREIRLDVLSDGHESLVTQTTNAVFKRPPGIARWVYPLLAKRTFRDQFRSLAHRYEHPIGR